MAFRHPVRVMLALAAAFPAAAQDDEAQYDQSKVPLEVDTRDPKLVKIVLVAGPQSHHPGDHEHFAGMALLMGLLRQTPGVFPVMARNGWPKNEKLFEHPVTRGVVPFAQQDEWYYNMRWCEGMKGVTPLLRAVPPNQTRGSEDAKKYPGRAEIVAWAFERPNGGRSFGITGGHSHKKWGESDCDCECE
jgi:hypothetical protein